MLCAGERHKIRTDNGKRERQKKKKKKRQPRRQRIVWTERKKQRVETVWWPQQKQKKNTTSTVTLSQEQCESCTGRRSACVSTWRKHNLYCRHCLLLHLPFPVASFLDSSWRWLHLPKISGVHLCDTSESDESSGTWQITHSHTLTLGYYYYSCNHMLFSHRKRLQDDYALFSATKPEIIVTFCGFICWAHFVHNAVIYILIQD